VTAKHLGLRPCSELVGANKQAGSKLENYFLRMALSSQEIARSLL